MCLELCDSRVWQQVSGTKECDGLKEVKLKGGLFAGTEQGYLDLACIRGSVVDRYFIRFRSPLFEAVSTPCLLSCNAKTLR